MNPVIRRLLRIGGGLCLACGLFPWIIFGISNTGVIALLLLGGGMVALPALWPRLLPYRRLRRLISVSGCAVLCFFVAVSVLIAGRAWFTPPLDSGKTAVIVLGGKVVGDQPTLMLRRRLDQAARYLERNPAAYCVVSGGQGPDEDYPEAVVMAQYLIRQGFAENRIRLEDRSTNTRQNLRYSQALMDGDEDQVVIVTDSFHQLRASIFASALGLETRNLSSLTPWGLMPSYWVREVLGVSWAWVSIQLGYESA